MELEGKKWLEEEEKKTQYVWKREEDGDKETISRGEGERELDRGWGGEEVNREGEVVGGGKEVYRGEGEVIGGGGEGEVDRWKWGVDGAGKEKWLEEEKEKWTEEKEKWSDEEEEKEKWQRKTEKRKSVWRRKRKKDRGKGGIRRQGWEGEGSEEEKRSVPVNSIDFFGLPGPAKRNAI